MPSKVTPVDVSGGDILPGDPRIPSGNKGWIIDSGQIRLNTPHAVVDGVKDLNGVNDPAGMGGTIKNSYLGDINDQSLMALTVRDATIDGQGNASFSPIMSTGDGSGNYGPIVVERVNAHGGGHGVLCYHSCTVRNSWLHDNTTADPNAHQNGILVTDGLNNSFTHNSVSCISASGCTSDIGLLNSPNNGPQVNETVSRNLLVHSSPSLGQRQTGFCAYPGPDNNPASFKVSGISWTDNVFQRGPNGRCALHGPVYAWYPSTCAPRPCTWTGNVWDDGTPLNQP